ncbi:MAG: hypothetical protein AAGA55_00530 [Planctomycetota bacterium]
MQPQTAHPKPVFRLFGYSTAGVVLRAGCIRAPLSALAAAVLIAGCGETRDNPGLDAYGERAGGVLAPDPVGGGHSAESAERGWSVLVAMVPSGRQGDADAMLGTVRSSGLSGAFLAERSGRPVVAFGSYDDPGGDDAQAGLARVRALEVAGMRPFATAVLMPPPAVRGSGSPSLDLRGVKTRLGDAAVYTLQVGVYGRADFERPTEQELALFREQAELAVNQLRADGEQAFYYHGPNSSSVTIGVFDEDDHDGSTLPAVESPALRALRERFPNNLINGVGLMETVKTDRGPVRRLQASRLVAIPKN